MAVENYDLIWAAGGDVREPTVQEKNTGFVSGPADPAVVNWLFQEQQQLFNDLLDYTNGLTIVDDLAIYVPSQFPTIQAALDFLSDKRIAPPAVVRIFVSPGEYVISAPLTFDHPNGNRVFVIGQNITTVWPDNTSIVSDKATTENTLRSIFPTVVKCIGTGAMVLLNHTIGRIENILFVGDGSSRVGLTMGSRDGQYGRSAAYLDTCWFHGFGSHGCFLEIGSQLTGDRVGFTHNGLDGIRNARSQMRISSLRCCRNVGSGLQTLNSANSVINDAIMANNGNNGVLTAYSSQTEGLRAKFRGNTGYQTLTNANSFLNLGAPDSDESSTGTEYFASLNSLQQIVGPIGSVTASPANGQTGNNNASTVIA